MARDIQFEVKAWQSIMNQFAYETEDFTVNLSSLKRDEIAGLKWVTAPLIDFTVWACENIVKHKERPKLKKRISYLMELQERQEEAFAQMVEDGEMAIKNIQTFLERKKEKHEPV